MVRMGMEHGQGGNGTQLEWEWNTVRIGMKCNQTWNGRMRIGQVWECVNGNVNMGMRTGK